MTKIQHKSQHCCVFSSSLNFSNEALQSVGIMKNANDMENQIFSKVQTQDDYRAMVGKLVKHLQSK